jgi:ribulose bisphosphate carboxylase small subunit
VDGYPIVPEMVNGFVGFTAKNVEESERPAVMARAREILHQGYNLAFEYHKKVRASSVTQKDKKH